MKYNLLFVPDSEKGTDDARLRCRIRWGGQTCAFLVGYRVDKSKWISESQRCRNNTTHGKGKTPASIINMRLQEIELAVSKLFLAEYNPTIEQIKEAVGKITSKDKAEKDNVYLLFGEFIKEQIQVAGWQPNTYKKQYTYRNHLHKFAPRLIVQELTTKFLDKLVLYYINKAEYENATIKKVLSDMKWFFRWLVSRGFQIDMGILTYKVRLKDVENPIIYLTWDEVMKMWNYEPQQDYLKRVKDVFLFCCFTSLRYSDVAQLKRENIINDTIQLVSQKTKDFLKIELNNYSKSILEKYSNCDKPLPVISNQKYNNYLKELAKLCGIDTPVTLVSICGSERSVETKPKYELITSHVARRTFISHAVIMGIPIPVIMKWTGHNDYKAMQPYIAIADEEKKKAMTLFNK